MADPRPLLKNARRLIIKVGTALVSRPDGALALGRLGSLVEAIHRLREDGRQVCLVSSGAVGLGRERLGLRGPPESIVDRQACAAAGQGALMALYDNLCARLGMTCAQVLLTEEDFLARHRYLHLADTLERLLGLGALPIINENDTVSIAELATGPKQVFGDNDRLSALVAAGTDADALFLLSDVEGVLSAPPGTPGAQRLPLLRSGVDVELGEAGKLGRGGMAAKIGAARMAAGAGVVVAIADGRDMGVLHKLCAGDDVGTVFPVHKRLSKRRRWLAFATRPVGRLWVNQGARDALVLRQASLLAKGVARVAGEFPSGSVVAVLDEQGLEFARGICRQGGSELRASLGKLTGRQPALLHRDDVVILGEALPGC